MSILQFDIPNARVLDLYAGSGALGLEALSRGAVSADFVEKDPRSLHALEENIESLDAGQLATIHRKSALTFVNGLETGAFDIAFADPPYATGDAVRLAERWKEVAFTRVLSIEHSIKDTMPAGGDTRKYGSTAITFYRSEE